jgi:hypothetical protein
MMRSNPLVTEVLAGLTRQGYAHLYYLALLALQASALFVLWPKGGVDELLASQHSPYALAGVVMAMGLSMAYFALRAGSEEILLPGQHGLRDWALATPLGLGRILGGYITGQIIQSLHQLALSAPIILVAFTVSGGEWAALGWCVAAALVQALFYRLCGAITHLRVGEHGARSLFTVRTILFVIYIPIGWIAPVTSHLALTYHTLSESVGSQRISAAAGDEGLFLALYAGLCVAAALTVYVLLLRERRSAARSRADFEEAIT